MTDSRTELRPNWSDADIVPAVGGTLAGRWPQDSGAVLGSRAAAALFCLRRERRDDLVASVLCRGWPSSTGSSSTCTGRTMHRHTSTPSMEAVKRGASSRSSRCNRLTTKPRPARVVEVEYLGDHRLRLSFSDGLVRELDFSNALTGRVLRTASWPRLLREGGGRRGCWNCRVAQRSRPGSRRSARGSRTREREVAAAASRVSPTSNGLTCMPLTLEGPSSAPAAVRRLTRGFLLKWWALDTRVRTRMTCGNGSGR